MQPRLLRDVGQAEVRDGERGHSGALLSLVERHGRGPASITVAAPIRGNTGAVALVPMWVGLNSSFFRVFSEQLRDDESRQVLFELCLVVLRVVYSVVASLTCSLRVGE